MDSILAKRLDCEGDFYDDKLSKKLVQVATQFIQFGVAALNYHQDDFDAANDLMEAYAPCTLAEYTARTRMSPRNFIFPMTCTQMTTLATFISQILYGAPTGKRVEARTDGDESAAKAMNQLLIWNDNQQDSYRMVYLWILDSLVFNRGVQYERWKDIYTVDVEPVYEEDITGTPEPVMKKDGSGPRLKSNGEPLFKYPKAERFRKRRLKTAGYVHIDLVAPADFICDPTLPLGRMQEGRFAGHRVMIPWYQLEERSRLDPTDYNYVLPESVKKLKGKNTSAGVSAMMPRGKDSKEPGSRSYYDRTGKQAPQAGMIGASGTVNKEDGGIIECFALIIKAKPKTYGIYDDDETELIEILIAGTELLSVNVLPNKHDEYPYCVGEARPNAHQQFRKSWALMVKPIQHRMDNLHNRHAEAQRRQGNVYLADGTKCDLPKFLDPDKDGLIIERKESGEGVPSEQIITQIPQTDTTAKFVEEVQWWESVGEKTTGAHAQMQGETEDPSQTLGQFETVTKMGTGRISTLARLLSSGALMPQVRRIAMNFQQFAPDEMIIRITGEDEEYDPDIEPANSITIRKKDIQCEFDYVPSDGALPGTDARKVAALSRMLEASANPAFAEYFNDTIPGNIDAKSILFEIAKAGGMPVNNFIIRRAKARKNLAEKQMAAGMGMQPPPQPTGDPGAPPPPPPETTMTGIPSAAQLPPTPSAEPEQSVAPPAL